MNNYLNKFYLLLFVAVLLAGATFAWQFYQTKNITVKPNTTPLISTGYYEIPTNDDAVLGNPGAPLTVVMFSDFVCSDCQKQYLTITNFVRQNPQSVRMFLKYSPSVNLFLKPNDLPVRAALCADKQSQFWPYLDALHSASSQSNEKTLNQIAADLKLNKIAWQNCLTSNDIQQKVAAESALSRTLNINTLPTFFINNKKLNLDKNLNIIDLLSKLISKP